jgi:hypothetical protein
MVQDTYTNEANDQTLTITGDARGVALNNVEASLVMNATPIGSVNGSQIFSVPGHTLVVSPEEQGSPHFVSTASAIWVNQSPYSFITSYSGGGTFVDVYKHGTLGSFTIAGGNSGPAQVTGHYQSQVFSGSLSDGVFNINGAGFSLVAPGEDLPAGIWVRGLVYLPSATGSNTFHAGEAGAYGICQLTLSGNNVLISGEDADGEFTGTIEATKVGVFLLDLVPQEEPVEGSPTTVPAVFVKEDGKLRVSELMPHLVSYPSDIRVTIERENQHSYLSYIGTAADDTGSGVPALYYTWPNANDQDRRIIKIHLDGNGTTRHTQYDSFPPIDTASIRYNPSTYHFRAPVPPTTPPEGESGAAASPPSFPRPVFSLEVEAGYRRLLLEVPESLPPSFLIRGEPWWYSGMDGAVHLYHGYYEGQEMRLPNAPNEDGRMVATLRDAYHNRHLDNPNQTTEGIFAPDRRSIRFRDNSIALPGDLAGGRELVDLNAEINLHTIQGDLDILGNNLSFGLLQGDRSLAGVLFQFRDTGSAAGLFNGISRPQAEWGWWKSGAAATDPPMPVMQLRPDHTLHLADPIPSTAEVPRAGIKLDPTVGGTSSIPGVLRVRPGGDLSMGEFRAGGQP